jgi:fumarate hydratase class II
VAVTEYRIEKDSLGEIKVPANALYGAQTQRAVENFVISGIRFPRTFIGALGLIKKAAAETNAELGLLDGKLADGIRRAATEVVEGKWDEYFPLDIFQTGSGTSTNMNANEVIANRATQLLSDEASKIRVHPNDHVNMSQSSNDVIPSAIHLCSYIQTQEVLLPGLRYLQTSLEKRASELDDVVKAGRTHLMDAMPVRMGQEIGGWAHQIQQSIERVESSLPRLSSLALGGTAVGTGVNAPAEFGRHVAERLARETGMPFHETENHFSAQSSMDTVAELSSQLKTTASALIKIANDLRWMNSGPFSGLGEIALPALQPGSSIMPGKINPVICEAVVMVCAQVIGNDVTVTIANGLGNFQLNVMLPIIAHNVIQSIDILGHSSRAMAEKAVAGFTVKREQIAASVERNPILVTALNPVIGYDRAAVIAKKAYAEGRRVKDVASEATDLSQEELDQLLDPGNMT